MEWQKGPYSINIDKSKLDLSMIHHFLYTTAHWAMGSTDEHHAEID
jgi:hypothetical protein